MIDITDFTPDNAYLVKTTVPHVLSFTKTQLDLTRLPDATVVAVGLDRSLWLFSVKPPSHNVELYSFRSGMKNFCSVNDVFDFCQTKSIAWAEL